LRILGIETTCDETSAAIVEDGNIIKSNVIATQFEFHKEYAGVVPEIASRRHHQVINYVIEDAYKKAGFGYKDIDAVAVAHYPGLIGSLLVGVIAAKTISLALRVPLIGINHIEAHLYSIHFTNQVVYPVIGLIISGGHTLMLISEEIGNYRIIGSTIDDAIGEAFDKVAKHLGLGYPGGPEIEKIAQYGRDDIYCFPRVTLNSGTDRYNFSYSGLKNAVINQRDRFLKKNIKPTTSDLAASFQAAATDVLLTKVKWASKDFNIKRVAIAGGVSNNNRVRKIFTEEEELLCYFPEKSLTMDNAAMVAGLAYHKYIQGKKDNLELEPRSRIGLILKGKRLKNGK